MLDVFGTLKALVARRVGANIDNSVFRLHYKFTALVIVTLSIAISARQHIGDPIDCIGQTATLPNHAKLLDEFCWIHGTFTYPSMLEEEDAIAPGVGKPLKGQSLDRTIHTYYYWVGFVLLFQAACFYLPHYIWKTLEKGKIKALMQNLQNPIISDEDRDKSIDVMVDYFKRNQNNHRFYFISFAVCEVLNFVNVVLQIVLVDRFVGGEFSTYGLDVLRFQNMDPALRVDPMVRVFPKISMCDFKSGSTGGGLNSQNVFCMLPVNIINEKIYIFLWFWFVILAVASGLQIIYRALIVFVPRLRIAALKKRAHLVPSGYIDTLLRSAELGDWFLIYQMSKNMDGSAYREFVSTLALRLENSENYKLKLLES